MKNLLINIDIILRGHILSFCECMVGSFKKEYRTNNDKEHKLFEEKVESIIGKNFDRLAKKYPNKVVKKEIF